MSTVTPSSLQPAADGASTTSRRPHRRESPSQWLRKNLFSSVTNSIITIVTVIVLGYASFSIVSWFATRDFEIVRFSLRIFMIGSFPDDQLIRLWEAGVLFALAIGFAGGALARSAYQIAIDSEIEAQPDSILRLLRRFWALIAVLFFFAAFASTIMPAVLVVLVIACVIAGRLVGWHAPAAVRARAAYITALLILAGMMAIAGTSSLGGFCVGVVIFVWVRAELVRILSRSASRPVPADQALDQTAVPFRFRIGAVVMDSFVAVLWAGVAILAGSFLALANIPALGIAASVLVYLAFLIWYPASIGRGGSPGQQTFGYRVVRNSDGANLGFWRAFAYTLAKTLSLLPLGLGYWWALWDKNHRTWHEKLTKSHAERTAPDYSKLAPYIGLIVGAVVGSVIARIGYDGYGWKDWGGLMVNVFAAVIGIALGMPLGILLALGRQSKLPVIKSTSVLFIEFVRGVPLISLLMFSITLLPLFLPPDFETPAPLTLAIIVIMFFSSAYIAEIVRGGLQAVAKGQTEAGQALGLSPGIVQRMIVLPQALRAVIPAMVGQFISLFKDTSLLFAANVLEFLGASTVANTQPQFLGKGLAPVTLSFVAIGFWAFAYTMSKESRRLERRLGVGSR